LKVEYDPVEIFKALSNPSRLAILKFIYKSGMTGTFDGEGPCCAQCSCMGDVVGKFDLAPSTISHHTRELVRTGLVRVERDGQFIRLLPNPEALEAASAFMNTVAESSGDG
jgi:ArsR family transcriptional regulator, arsenate/arsenite/antimonite-responsive transcriptional repressor